MFEVLVVLVILGMVAGMVGPAAFRQLGWARSAVARQSIEQIGMILDLYKLDVGAYPSTEQGLQALVVQPAGVTNWNGPYVKGDKVPLDPWNQPYTYRSPSTRTNDEYDLCSKGPPDTGSAEAAICNH